MLVGGTSPGHSAEEDSFDGKRERESEEREPICYIPGSGLRYKQGLHIERGGRERRETGERGEREREREREKRGGGPWKANSC